MSRGGPCRVRSKLNRFEHVHGAGWEVPVQGAGLGMGLYRGDGGPYMVRSIASWVIVIWGPPSVDIMTDRQMRLKTLPSRNFAGR